MRTNLTVVMLVTVVASVLLGWAPAMAQQTTGMPGSPNATTTIDGRYLPNPPSKFGGSIGLGAKDSTPIGSRKWCPPRARPMSC